MKTLLVVTLTAALAWAACGQAHAAGCDVFPRTVQLAEGQALAFALSQADGCALSLLYRVPRQAPFSGCAVLRADYTFGPAGSAALVTDTMQDRVCFADGDKAYTFARGRRPHKLRLTSLGGPVEVTFREKPQP